MTAVPERSDIVSVSRTPAPDSKWPLASCCGAACACAQRPFQGGDIRVPDVTEMRDHARAGRVLLADDPVAGRVTASATGLARTVLCAFGWPLVALVAGAALGQTQGEAVGVVGALAGAALGLATFGSFAPALAAGLRLERQGPPQAEQEQGESQRGPNQQV